MQNMTTRSESLIRAQEAYEAKTVKLNVRLKREERDRLEALALAAGTTPTAMIKRWIEKAKLK
jgi:6-phosphogluconolactonase/glucosamine-6-phosphate isomerase/deaminase